MRQRSEILTARRRQTLVSQLMEMRPTSEGLAAAGGYCKVVFEAGDEFHKGAIDRDELRRRLDAALIRACGRLMGEQSRTAA
jgi:hypothetical protein